MQGPPKFTSHPLFPRSNWKMCPTKIGRKKSLDSGPTKKMKRIPRLMVEGPPKRHCHLHQVRKADWRTAKFAKVRRF